MNQEPNKETQNKVDPKTVTPEVLGHLRTEKIGNPSMLIAFIAIIVIVLLILPLLSSMLQNTNSPLYKLIYGSEDSVEVINNNSDEFVDGSKINELTNTVSIKLGNLIMSNFTLDNGVVNCYIQSFNGILDLDEKNYYLNIYSSVNEEDLIGYVKIVGTNYDSTSTYVSLYNQLLKFNTTRNYYGKIVEYESDNDYPSYNVNSDESGIGSITCKMGSREIEYIFENNYLIAFNDTVKEKLKNHSNEEYLSLLKEYNDKVKELSSVSSITEEEEGFTYIAKVNYSQYKLPKDFKDTNYYEENTLAKVIIYSEIGKGFDCK